jgi:hypothetical protein
VHPAGLGADHVEIAQHERGDLHDDLRAPQPVETGDQVAHRRGGGEQQRREHAEGALRGDVPGAVQPVDRQRQAQPGDPLTTAEERQHHREQHERQFDGGPPEQPPRRHPTECRHRHQQQRVRPERPQVLTRGGNHDDRERHHRHDLDLGRQPVQPASPVEIQRVGVARAH